MYCRNCGSKLEEGEKFCGNCGTKVNDADITATVKNKVNDADITATVKSFVKETAEKVKTNAFVQSVKQDIANSQSLNIIKDKAKASLNSADRSASLKRFVMVGCVVAPVLLIIAWFLPAVKLYGEAYSVLRVARLVGGGAKNSIRLRFWFMELSCAASIAWVVIPKKWAAFVGAAYSICPMLLTIGQVIYWLFEGVPVCFGPVLAALLSIAGFVLSVGKLVIPMIEKNQNQTVVRVNHEPMA